MIDSDPVDKKSFSTSTITVTSTIENPNVKEVVEAVSQLIFSIMIEDIKEGKTVPNENSLAYELFEDKYMKQFPERFGESQKTLLQKTPTAEDISAFVFALYDVLRFSEECVILMLVYINRLVVQAEIPILPTNWRPVVVLCLLTAQKMWDDISFKNDAFVDVYPFFSNEELNKLEVVFLRLINYHLNVKFSVYAKYFCELRDIFPHKNFLKPMDQLTFNLMNSKSKEVEEKSKKYSRSSADLQESGHWTIKVIN